MTIDEAMKILRQHNEKGASVLRITRGQALEKDLLEQVLDSCEQLISERAEYKRLLKAAVEDFSEMKPYLSEPYSHLCDKWRYADEAFALIGEKGDINE